MKKIKYKKEKNELFRLAFFPTDLGIRINAPKLRKSLGIQKEFNLLLNLSKAVKSISKYKG